MDINYIKTVLEEDIKRLGCKVWGFELFGRRSNQTLRIYIDKNEGISVEDCEKVSKHVSKVLLTNKFATSKIYVVVTQNIQVWNNANYATGRWRILRNINGGSYNAIMEDSSSQNGNIFAYDYGGSGINVYSPMTYQLLDTPNTTNEVIYKTQIARGSNGGNRITSDGSNPGRMTLLEIAQ